ncbi:hypothetical protein GCG54_00007630 [Colletotrichum gloeosporioides]|uniref:CENP-V/GFA domain-containing protein n=1 Tax=Colletotrichum gloeosporioides TaxID=474922 RepID=A0A8H4CPW8_COLGL|nr:uncharacterized protein GCG54_00007630 [Colletotrichum gloeosporioides]KAF3807894.1 hypothetical protein GCG54_00007630 [Colletotrichum gloeosporioides]
MSSFSGSCLCGGILVSISSNPVTIFTCFCDHCCKGAGGTHQVIAKFTHKSVAITTGSDLVSHFTLNNTSSGLAKEKAFCRVCGTPLWTAPASAQGQFLLIRTSLLDGGTALTSLGTRSNLTPEAEVFVKSRPAWQHAVDGAVQWEGMRR